MFLRALLGLGLIAVGQLAAIVIARVVIPQREDR